MKNICDPFDFSTGIPFTVKAIDQRLLPHTESWVLLNSPDDYYSAINKMVVRGAPLIGFTAIFSCANWFSTQKIVTQDSFKKYADYLKSARPTAVNLAFEIDRIWAIVKDSGSEGTKLANATWNHGLLQIKLLFEKNSKMAKFVSDDLISRYGNTRLNVLTICNTGRLACGTLGTALGAIEFLHKNNSINHVFACETRPYLQGSRLTAFELKALNIDFSLLVEGASRQLFKTHKIHAVFAGADRIASNGDTANKVGTSVLAEIAERFNVPFYILAPLSSFDVKAKNGDEIPIEFREDTEITEFFGKPVSPIGCKTFNPCFDVTPNHLITGGISCETSLLKQDFKTSIENAFTGN